MKGKFKVTFVTHPLQVWKAGDGDLAKIPLSCWSIYKRKLSKQGFVQLVIHSILKRTIRMCGEPIYTKSLSKAGPSLDMDMSNF